MRLLTQLWRVFLDTIFPMRADARLVAELSADELLSLMMPRNTDSMTMLLPFADERIRASIHEVKFHENHTAVHLLAAVLRSYIQQHQNNTPIVIPVPLSPRRLRERGYNQVTLIAQAAGLHLETSILQRNRETAPQTSLPRAARLRNVADAFSVQDPERATRKLEGTHVIVLDDVTTTGATLKAARAALAPLKPASITCLALAH